MPNEISLSVVRRRTGDRAFMSRVLYVGDVDAHAKLLGLPAHTFYFVVPVEGVDGTPMGSAYMKPAVTVNGIKLSGKTFVLTNNEQRIHFPFSMRAFRGLLFVEIGAYVGEKVPDMGSIQLILTCEDHQGNLRQSGPIDVENSKDTNMGNLRDNLMPW
jgi:hypothetical protein